MDHKFVVVFIMAPSRETARQIAHHLVKNRLAACVNIAAPIESIYTWEGQIHQEEELLLIVKTRAELVESKLIPAVQSLHPYQVPEIIALPIQAGLPSYMNWIQESTDL